MVVRSDAYTGAVSTVVVAKVTKNLAMASDPAHVFIDTSTLDGRATGLDRDSVASPCPVLVTVYTDTVAQGLGTLWPALMPRSSTGA